MANFLPISKADMKVRGWEQCDFVYISGDAYVDHPSFGCAIITRVLESHGYKVGVIAQPNWKNPQSITALGKPRLGFLVSGGNMDSMVNHYSVSKKHRKTDAYSPGGEMDKRPDYAATVYCNLIRQTYKDVPILLGGIEASLRRLGHYDYWSDKMKRSILLDSQADLVMYGMGERSVVEIADALQSGLAVSDITFVNGTIYKTRDLSSVVDYETLPDYNSLVSNRKNYAKSFQTQYKHTDHFTAKALVEPYPDGWFVVQNIPQAPMSQGEMDRVYSLDYARTYHPIYEPLGGIPAIEEVQFSLISNRGCFGACNFCALTFHQGRIIQTRSHESLVQEAELMTWEPDFKGYIHDVGGPTANFRHPSCQKQLEKGVCKDRQCLFPTPCKNLDGDHSDYLALLQKLRNIPKVKKVFIRSGIRFDYLLADKNNRFFDELVKHHVSGQLKVAPEHVSNNVLEMMGKPRHEVYEKFREKYIKTNEKQGKKQFVVPYLMSSHPGCTMNDAVILAEYLRDIGYHPEQVQDFYPTPSTVSTVMYATGLDPRTMRPVYVPTNPHEKAMQRALIQYRNPKNYALVHEALVAAKREDLIGHEKGCLIRPKGSNYTRRPAGAKPKTQELSRSGKKKPKIERVDTLPKELKRGAVRRDKDGNVIPMKKHKPSRNSKNNFKKR